MGGKSSKLNEVIEPTLEICNIPKFDSYFNDANTALKKAEDIREALTKSITRIFDITRCNFVKGDLDVQYQTAFKVFFWALSAKSGGKIGTTTLRILTSSPFLDMNSEIDDKTISELYNCLQGLIKSLQYEKTLNSIEFEIYHLTQRIKVPKKSIDDEVARCKLDDQAAKNARSIVNQNSTHLTNQYFKILHLIEMTEIVSSAIRTSKLAEMLRGVDEIGKKAAAEGLKDPAMIFEKFHQGKKRTQKEIEKQQEAWNKKLSKRKFRVPKLKSFNSGEMKTPGSENLLGDNGSSLPQNELGMMLNPNNKSVLGIQFDGKASRNGSHAAVPSINIIQPDSSPNGNHSARSSQQSNHEENLMTDEDFNDETTIPNKLLMLKKPDIKKL